MIHLGKLDVKGIRAVCGPEFSGPYLLPECGRHKAPETRESRSGGVMVFSAVPAHTNDHVAEQHSDHTDEYARRP